MDNNHIRNELDKIVYQTFESGHFDFFRATNAANNQRNEVQFRLSKNIANLNDKNRDTILADVHLAHAMGWMTTESYDKAVKLIEAIT